MDIAVLIIEYGFPTGLLLIIIWGMKTAGKFIKPLVTRGVESHIELVDSLKETTEKQTVVMEDLKETSNKQIALMENQTEFIKTNSVKLSDLHAIATKQEE